MRFSFPFVKGNRDADAAKQAPMDGATLPPAPLVERRISSSPSGLANHTARLSLEQLEDRAVMSGGNDWDVVFSGIVPKDLANFGRVERDIQVVPGDQIKIDATLTAGPIPPGPTTMHISYNGKTETLNATEVGPDGKPTSAASGFEKSFTTTKTHEDIIFEAHNYDRDDNATVTISVRKHANLIALQPNFTDDGGVSYGYSVGPDVSPDWQGQNVMVKLYCQYESSTGQFTKVEVDRQELNGTPGFSARFSVSRSNLLSRIPQQAVSESRLLYAIIDENNAVLETTKTDNRKDILIPRLAASSLQFDPSNDNLSFSVALADVSSGGTYPKVREQLNWVDANSKPLGVILDDSFNLLTPPGNPRVITKTQLGTPPIGARGVALSINSDDHLLEINKADDVKAVSLPKDLVESRLDVTNLTWVNKGDLSLTYNLNQAQIPDSTPAVLKLYWATDPNNQSSWNVIGQKSLSWKTPSATLNVSAATLARNWTGEPTLMARIEVAPMANVVIHNDAVKLRTLDAVNLTLSGELESAVPEQGPARLRMAKWLELNSKLISSTARKFHIPAQALAAAVAYEGLENVSALATTLAKVDPASYDAFAVEKNPSNPARYATLLPRTTEDRATQLQDPKVALQYVAAIMHAYVNRAQAKITNLDLAKQVPILVSLFKGLLPGGTSRTAGETTGLDRMATESAVGYVTRDFLSGSPTNNMFHNGSGFLITPTLVLTAEHNVEKGGFAPFNSKFVPLNSVGIDISAIASDEKYNSNKQGDFDLALVTLAKPVTDVLPLKLYRPDPAKGMPLMMYGYPGSSNSNLGSPFLRTYQSVVDDVAVGGDSISWSLDPSLHHPNPPDGTSGGPVTVTVNGVEQVVGLIRAQRDNNFIVARLDFGWLNNEINKAILASKQINLGDFDYYLRAGNKPTATSEISSWYSANSNFLSAVLTPPKAGTALDGSSALDLGNSSILDPASLPGDVNQDWEVNSDDLAAFDAGRLQWSADAATMDPAARAALLAKLDIDGDGTPSSKDRVLLQQLITLNAPGNDPVAVDDTVTTAFGSSVEIHPVSNDHIPSIKHVVISEIGSAKHGTVTTDSSDPLKLLYTPAQNYSGPDTFSYVIQDDQGYTSDATVNILVGPPAPSNLHIANCWQTAFDVNWDPVPSATQYKVSVSSDGGSSWETPVTVDGGKLGARIEGRQPARTYLVRVEALDGHSSSNWSQPISVTTTPMAPAAPTNLAAAGRSVNALLLSWQDSAINNEDRYEFQFSLRGAESWHAGGFSPANSNTYSLTNLSAHTAFDIRMRAVNEGGTSAWVSLQGISTRDYAPQIPANLRVANRWVHRFDVNWNDVSNESGYQLSLSQDNGATWGALVGVYANVTGATFDALRPNTSYLVRVRAFNDDGISDWSSPLAVTTAPLPVPTNLRADNIWARKIDLRWDDPSTEETGYEIWMSADGGATWSGIGQSGASAVSSRVTALLPAHAYLFAVDATYPDGRSGLSNVLSVTTAALPPPGNLRAANVWATTIDLNWNDPSDDETGFKIWMSGDGGHTWSLVGLPGQDATSLRVTGLLKNHRYQFVAATVTPVGESGKSNILDVTTKSA